MSTDDTRPLPAAEDETRERAVEPATVDETPTQVVEPVPADEPEKADEPLGTTRPLPTTDVPAGATRTAAPLSGFGTAPAPRPAPEPETPAGPELRVGTVVWGLVVAVVGIGIVSFAWGARIDGGLALIVLLAGAGVALLVGSLVMAVRRPRGRAGRG